MQTDMILDTAVETTKTLSTASSFDSAAIYVIVIFSIIVVLIITYILHINRSDIKALSGKLDDMANGCLVRSNKKKDFLEVQIKILQVEIRNLFLTISELLGKNNVSITDAKTALEVFSFVMKAHCLETALLTCHAIMNRSQRSSIEDIVAYLSREWKNITEHECELFSKIKYTVSDKLSDLLYPLLQNEAWESFTEEVIKPLVTDNLFQPDVLIIKDRVLEVLNKKVDSMKDIIKTNGGLNG